MLYLPTDDVIAGFAYPPPAIVPFMWLQRLPLGAALLLFTVASYAALAGAVRLWLSLLQKQGVVADTRTKFAVVLIALAAGPTYMNAVFGQVNTFVLACSVAFVSLAPLAAVCRGRRAGVWDLAEGVSRSCSSPSARGIAVRGALSDGRWQARPSLRSSSCR